MASASRLTRLRAERAHNPARYDYLTNLLVLERPAGELTGRDLAGVHDLRVEQAR